MKLKNMKREELEVLSYMDLTELILNECQCSMTTPDMFKKICELLELGEDEYTSKIGDYYTSLTTDKRFVLLENAEWDLRDKHKLELVLDEEDLEDEVYDEEETEDLETEEENMDESIEITDDEIDLDDEDMEELSIIDEEDLEEEL